MTMTTFGVRGEPLAPHTSLRIGGPADFFLRIASEKDLLDAIQVARENELPVFVLGGGTTCSSRIAGGRAWCCRRVARMGPPTAIGTASSGTELAHVAAVAARSGLEGLEWMATVPGTVGGAVHGNAGAFGTETADVLVDAELVDLNGDTWTATVNELGYSYRKSALQGTPIVCVRARFRGKAGDRANAVKRIKEMANERIKKQPLAQPNTGSIFRNPPGDFAGRLIEAAGLKGRAIGGATVSEKHANFIVNANGATACDVRSLMALVQREVAKQFDVKLVPEVELVGEW